MKNLKTIAILTEDLRNQINSSNKIIIDAVTYSHRHPKETIALLPKYVEITIKLTNENENYIGFYTSYKGKDILLNTFRTGGKHKITAHLPMDKHISYSDILNALNDIGRTDLIDGINIWSSPKEKRFFELLNQEIEKFELVTAYIEDRNNKDQEIIKVLTSCNFKVYHTNRTYYRTVRLTKSISIDIKFEVSGGQVYQLDANRSTLNLSGSTGIERANNIKELVDECDQRNPLN